MAVEGAKGVTCFTTEGDLTTSSEIVSELDERKLEKGEGCVDCACKLYDFRSGLWRSIDNGMFSNGMPGSV